MKKRSWKIWVKLGIILFVIIYLLYPFIPKKEERPFRQPYENIVSVSIWQAPINPGEPIAAECLRELPLEEGIELLDKLKSQDVKCAWFSTMRNVHDAFVEVVYQDGEIEQINERNCCWKEPDGLWQYRGYYFVDWRLFHRTLEQYY